LKETLFYQIRQDNTLSVTELSLLVRQAFVALYPGTSFDHDMTFLHGSENRFFLTRAGKRESIAVFVTLDELDKSMLAGTQRDAAAAEFCIREARSGMQDFLTTIVAKKVPEGIKKEILTCQPGLSCFEYLLLQSETDEGLALKPIEKSLALPMAERLTPVPAPKIISPEVLNPIRTSDSGIDRRLSPEELNALIDLSLGLEMKTRGVEWDLPVTRKPDNDA